ncbi:THOC1-like protein [Mya arenaria]|uniref:THOC1-like protein n=1 Tax=Mya arenaria TaxID=6604 RepID=A0ABY7FQR4_MYAAR|nr:THO complex subunit 1-like [Mya arenaria]WAR23251.1 THOC1-like protein [Mya arenaria]
MATPAIFDFCEARKTFNQVVHSVAEENSLDPYKEFIQDFAASESEKRVAADQAFRDVLHELCVLSDGCEVYKNFICQSIEAAQSDLISTSVPFLLLTDAFDVMPLDQCEVLFNLVEDKVRVWKSSAFYVTGKNFLLRMCNDLLRRLSKSQNTVFCGRIQLFLSRLFPLAEKSALNLMSQFNIENVTLYNQAKSEQSNSPEKKEGEGDVKTESMEVEDGEADKPKEVPIDYNLYRKFWSLQDYFRKPSQCYEKKFWSVFVSNAEAVFAAFSSSKLDDLKSSKKTPSLRMGTLEPDSFFAKYLTSEKLLDLQLNDSNFRRYVLLQFLIIFQYLRASVKFKTPAQSLTDDQSGWMKAQTEAIYQLIRETPPDGEKFARTVEHMLEREEHWNQWKNDGCPDFEKKPEEGDSKKSRRPKRRRVGDDLQITGGKVVKMGNPELTKLWNLHPSNMEACKAEDRMFLPTLEEFFQEAIEQNDPVNLVEEEYRSTNDQTFQWKALRLLARRSPLFFTNSATPALELKVYLNAMLGKLAKQMPREGSEEMKTGVEDEEEIKEGEEEAHNSTQPVEETEPEPEHRDIVLNKHIIRSVADKIGGDWKKVAVELRIPDEDITFFDSEGGSGADLANRVITIWMESDPEKNTAESLRLALKEVGLSEVADTLAVPS